MGDRANIAIYEGDGPMTFFYTHWTGYDLPNVLKTALERGQSRWSDPPYLSRIIFSEMIKGHERELDGFGISSTCGDNSYPLLVVNMTNQTIGEMGEKYLTNWRDEVFNKNLFIEVPFSEYSGKWQS